MHDVKVKACKSNWAASAAALCALALAGQAIAQSATADQRRAERLAARRAQGMRAVFDQPQLELRETGGRTVAVAANAIVARERYLVHAVRMVLAADVQVGAPFGVAFPARSLLLVRTGDPARARCLLPNPVPHDERGRAYPDVCLIDVNGDGLFETARFHAEDPGDPPRDMPIAPVALRQLRTAPQPGLLSIAAEQRLRILRVTRDAVTILVESRLAPVGVSAELPWSSRPAAQSQFVLRLADGASVRAAGLQLTARRGAGGAWTIATDGEFAPWLRLRDDNAVIDAGAVTMGAR